MWREIGSKPPELEQELFPEPHEEIFFDMFFQIYSPEQNFYVVLKAYCDIWEIELDGEDITLLENMWRTAESWRIERQKKQQEAMKKKQNKGTSSPTHRPRPSRRR